MRMQTKLTDHTTDPPSIYNSKPNSKCPNQVSSNSKEKDNNENDLDLSDLTTPKSKRIRMMVSLDKKLNCPSPSAKMVTLLNNKYASLLTCSIIFTSGEKFRLLII